MEKTLLDLQGYVAYNINGVHVHQGILQAKK